MPDIVCPWAFCKHNDFSGEFDGKCKSDKTIRLKSIESGKEELLDCSEFAFEEAVANGRNDAITA